MNVIIYYRLHRRQRPGSTAQHREEREQFRCVCLLVGCCLCNCNAFTAFSSFLLILLSAPLRPLRLRRLLGLLLCRMMIWKKQLTHELMKVVNREFNWTFRSPHTHTHTHASQTGDELYMKSDFLSSLFFLFLLRVFQINCLCWISEFPKVSEQ